MNTQIRIGMNARLFPNNWRPTQREIAFARAHGFQAIQFSDRKEELDEEYLGDDYSTVATAIQRSGLIVALEMLIRIDTRGQTVSSATPLDVLKANLPAILTLPCRYVHWHLALTELLPEETVRALEQALAPQLAEGATIAEQYHFQLGLENNEPDESLFGNPDSCKLLLETVPNLKFVWDINHTIPEHVSGFRTLIPFMSMIHIADTPLPAVNHHLPLGLGTIDFVDHCRVLLATKFQGPAILEIGGLPKSGGVGRDTDNALIDSYQRFAHVLEIASEEQYA